MSAVQVFLKDFGKRKMAHNEQFSLFPQCFLSFKRTFPPFSSNLKMSSTNSFSLEESNIFCLGRDNVETEKKKFRLVQFGFVARNNINVDKIKVFVQRKYGWKWEKCPHATLTPFSNNLFKCILLLRRKNPWVSSITNAFQLFRKLTENKRAMMALESLT